MWLTFAPYFNLDIYHLLEGLLPSQTTVVAVTPTHWCERETERERERERVHKYLACAIQFYSPLWMYYIWPLEKSIYQNSVITIECTQYLVFLDECTLCFNQRKKKRKTLLNVFIHLRRKKFTQKKTLNKWFPLIKEPKHNKCTLFS